MSFDTIKATCMGGEGHYLGSAQTLKVMQSEYLYPEYSDRSSPMVWADSGKPELLKNAIARKKEILQRYFPSHISDETDQRIRAGFPVFLSREAIGRG
jgi:trimethylamine--corrinoid protein Co-methyltransferase